jgi:hypothetical protein
MSLYSWQVVDLVEFRRMKSQDFADLVARPGMWATNGTDLQFAGFRLLDDLSRLDDAPDPDWLGPFLHRFGKLGIKGAFAGTFGDGDYRDEVASVLAEAAARMRHFEPAGPHVTELDHRRLVDRVTDLWLDRDVAYDEALAVLTEPTLVVCQVTRSTTGSS